MVYRKRDMCWKNSMSCLYSVEAVYRILFSVGGGAADGLNGQQGPAVGSRDRVYVAAAQQEGVTII